MGCFEFIGGSLTGLLADKFNKFSVANITNIILEAAIVTSLLAYLSESYTICFFAGAFW